MRDILSDESRPVLDDVARRRTFLVFDFDGTLAPLGDDRDAARVPDSTRRVDGLDDRVDMLERMLG